MTKEHEHHILSYRFLALVWLALMVLTAVTVYAAGIDFGYGNVVVALAIATTKATLVVLFFMHLKYENRSFQFMVILCFAILAIFIGFTFFDVAAR